MKTTKHIQNLIDTIRSIPRPVDSSNIWDCVTLLTVALEDMLVLLNGKDRQIQQLKMDVDALNHKLEEGSQV